LVGGFLGCVTLRLFCTAWGPDAESLFVKFFPVWIMVGWVMGSFLCCSWTHMVPCETQKTRAFYEAFVLIITVLIAAYRERWVLITILSLGLVVDRAWTRGHMDNAPYFWEKIRLSGKTRRFWGVLLVGGAVCTLFIASLFPLLRRI